MLPHPVYDFLYFSPDGISVGFDENKNVVDLRLIEVKCPMKRKIEVDPSTGLAIIPSYNKYQPQMGLDVLRGFGLITTCDFIQFTPDNEMYSHTKSIYITPVELDIEHWDNDVVPQLISLWGMILDVKNGKMTIDELFKIEGLLKKTYSNGQIFTNSVKKFFPKSMSIVEKPLVEIKKSLRICPFLSE